MRIISAAVILIATVNLSAAANTVPRPAPPWQVSEWINGPATTIEAQRGKVLVVDFLQLWCPGCNKFSIPLMEHWKSVFAKDIAAGRLKMVSIHTVFEGHDYQNPKRLRRFLEDKKIDHLVGVDEQVGDEWLPRTMRAYKTRGTPEMAFIDKKGVVRFQRFGGFDPAKAEKLLRQLLAEKNAPGL